jgi:hypothetical protein
MSLFPDNDWFFQLNNLCDLDSSTVTMLKNEKEIKKIFAKSSRLKDTDINKQISKPLSNFVEHFAKINQYNPGMPVYINNEDITLFFIDYFYGFNIDIWNTFFVGSNGIPERCIETLICRVQLDTKVYLPHRECIRYALLYCVFKFHYNNIYFVKQYLTVLKNSITTKHQFKYNNLYNDYVELLYKTSIEIIDKHNQISELNSTNLNYTDIYDDIVMLYQIVSMLEKLIYSIISDIKLCEYDLNETLNYFDPVLYNKYRGKYTSCDCMIEKPSKDCSSFFIIKLKKITSQILTCIQENKTCLATFEFQ